MEFPLFAVIAQLRAAVGFLGEREQYGWWQSAFLSAGSKPFLAPVFSRRLVLAQYTGVTRAAALIHDERIGVGRVFHLFRLPEDLEQGIQHAVGEPQVAQQIDSLVATQETALTYLHGEARSASGGGVGPTRVGAAASLRERRLWRIVAGQYAHAFITKSQVYPYLTELT